MCFCFCIGSHSRQYIANHAHLLCSRHLAKSKHFHTNMSTFAIDKSPHIRRARLRASTAHTPNDWFSNDFCKCEQTVIPGGPANLPNSGVRWAARIKRASGAHQARIKRARPLPRVRARKGPPKRNEPGVRLVLVALAIFNTEKTN